jgi:hypothetical protein
MRIDILIIVRILVAVNSWDASTHIVLGASSVWSGREASRFIIGRVDFGCWRVDFVGGGSRGELATSLQSLEPTRKIRESCFSNMAIRTTLMGDLLLKSREVGRNLLVQGSLGCAKRVPNCLLHTGCGGGRRLGHRGQNERF